MRSSTLLARTADFAIRSVTCAGGPAHWSPAEECDEYGVVLVRSGFFRLRSGGRDVLAEPATAYVQRPGEQMLFAHPRGGDTCTALVLSADLWHGSHGEATGPVAVPVDARIELRHLLLLRAAAAGDLAYEVPESLVRLVGDAVRAAPAPHPGAAGARLALAAREAILAGEPDAADLVGLARRLGVSPHHLSRTFGAHTGTSLTRYRNRVRVSRALRHLGDGETDLAGLAADLGFADQAHLTRTVVAHVGHPPGALRRLVGGPGGAQSLPGSMPGGYLPVNPL